MSKNRTIGLLLVLSTAVISGFSIFINKYGVKETNPYVFTFVKNLIAALPFLFLAIPAYREIKKLDVKNKILLLMIAVVGGSIPFLLFFKGLSMANAANASFIQKTMFLYIALFGVYFLKEKLNWISAVGVSALMIGSLMFFKVQPGKLGIGELYILLATLFWAGELLISKKLLRDISANLIIFSRMFLGSILIFIYLLFSHQAPLLLKLNSHQWTWLLIGGAMLFGYVLTFYHGLKRVSATEATAILTIGAPITALLTLGVQNKPLLPNQPLAILIVVIGIILIILSKTILSSLLSRVSFLRPRPPVASCEGGRQESSK